MTNKKIKEILYQHKLWLTDHSKGKRANFSWENLRGVNLCRANLRSAELRWTNLSNADLSGADLRWVDLGGAKIIGADLSGVDLSNADLRGIDLRGVDLTKIKDYETTGVWLNYKLVPIRQIIIWQKMIANKDKSTAILYKNTWMADECKKVLINT